MTLVTLRAGQDTVTIDPAAGGRMTSAVLGGAERLVTAPPAEGGALAHVQWGAFVMAPWAGRLAHGRLEWRGHEHAFPTDATGHALHGVAHTAPWQVSQSTGSDATLACDLAAAGWPLGGQVEHRVDLAPGRLVCRLRVTAGEQAMPAWLGWHPCFRRPDRGDMRLGLTAEAVLETRDGLPTGRRLAVDDDHDLTDTPPLDGRRLDDAYVGVRSPARLSWPDLDLLVGFDETVDTVVAFTPPHQVGVEPQTAWPDAVALAGRGVDGTGVTELAPGASLASHMTWDWTPT